ncbi:MAG: NAD(P)H-dependent glycerol-3-phosphate dehydrogenase [Actinomycetaceae bacterium]|nr:NAD(P)H-dependent glycerol-3-phosphate dehydrogenase [Actinomycetaceae bacterium]
MSIQRVGIIGTGAWGTTFAQVLADAGRDVIMWGRSVETVAQIQSGSNQRYLPGIRLSPQITATTDRSAVTTGVDLIVVVLPTQVIRETLTPFRDLISPETPILSLSKGLERDSLKLVTNIISEAASVELYRIAALSGPNLSREIIEKHPTATVVAANNEDLAAEIAQACHNPYFRPYVSTDLTGVEVAGATKNVIAVAVGAAEGMGWGSNTRTTLITRGLAEMTRFGIALGAHPDTFSGLAGMGDLIATCSSKLSRNFSFGYRVGQGMSLDEAYALSVGVVEGAATAGPLVRQAEKLGVDMPISKAVSSVINEGASVEDIGKLLLGRPRKRDGWRIRLV